jgi:hypothetical protein
VLRGLRIALPQSLDQRRGVFLRVHRRLAFPFVGPIRLRRPFHPGSLPLPDTLPRLRTVPDQTLVGSPHSTPGWTRGQWARATPEWALPHRTRRMTLFPAQAVARLAVQPVLGSGSHQANPQGWTPTPAQKKTRFSLGDPIPLFALTK